MGQDSSLLGQMNGLVATIDTYGLKHGAGFKFVGPNEWASSYYRYLWFKAWGRIQVYWAK